MSNEIQRADAAIERTWDGKRVRTSREQLVKALAPMFVAFPNLEMSDETFSAYYMMLCDIAPDVLAVAVLKACKAHEYPTHLITAAAILKQIETRTPGPRSDIDPAGRKPIPMKMFRLPEDEDKRQRLERLRQTKGWNYA